MATYCVFVCAPDQEKFPYLASHPDEGMSSGSKAEEEELVVRVDCTWCTCSNKLSLPIQACSLLQIASMAYVGSPL